MDSRLTSHKSLASLAATSETGGERLHPEAASSPRSEFQRDRDRILHSAAFRRLQFKTQVFVYHEGDHYRTRLTHSLEVAQVARSISRILQLDEDLSEALALAHDLGHTPFGHAGERALDECMRLHGGFDHNAQSIRVVTRLERRYGAFDGLNLTRTCLDGLIKHNGPISAENEPPSVTSGKAGTPKILLELVENLGIDPKLHAGVEAQIAAISDDIAYNAHDIDDGLRAGLFDIIDLGDVPLAGSALTHAIKAHPRLERSRLVHETVRRVISSMIFDVVVQTSRNAEEFAVNSNADVRSLGRGLVEFSPQMRENNRALQGFLTRRMYQHRRVTDVMDRAQRIIRDLFDAYMSDARLLPPDWLERNPVDDESGFARQVCDFIAGMTDRYAIEQHKRLFDLNPLFG